MGAHSEDDRRTCNRPKSNREVGNIAGCGPKGTKCPVCLIARIRILGREWPALEG